MTTPRTDAFRKIVGGAYPNERTEHEQIMDLIAFAEGLELELQAAIDRCAEEAFPARMTVQNEYDSARMDAKKDILLLKNAFASTTTRVK